MTYDPAPAYPLARGVVDKGLPRLGTGARAVALDGPAALPWDAVIAGLRGCARAGRRGRRRVGARGMGAALAGFGELWLAGFPKRLAWGGQWLRRRLGIQTGAVRSFAAERVVVGGSIARACNLFAGSLRGVDLGVAVPADRLDDAPLLGAARYAAS